MFLRCCGTNACQRGLLRRRPRSLSAAGNPESRKNNGFSFYFCDIAPAYRASRPGKSRVYRHIRQERGNMGETSPTRRTVLTTAAAATATALAAPFAHFAFAAGTLSVWCLDPWVPGDNAT